MNILVTGTTGFVGARLCKDLNAIAAPSFRTIDEEGIRKMMDQTQPDVIIHTAAISDIATCEKDPEGSHRANVDVPMWLAKHRGAAKLICFSSDQVYHGNLNAGPYVETDVVTPDNTYGCHKLQMEQRVLDIDPDSVHLRAEWMYDFISPKLNYYLLMKQAVEKQQDIAYSNQQYRGVTYLREVSESMEAVMKLPGGVYNFGSETELSMYEVTRQYLQMMGGQCKVMDAPAQHNLWMDCSKATKLGVRFSNILDGLYRCYQDDKKCGGMQ